VASTIGIATRRAHVHRRDRPPQRVPHRSGTRPQRDRHRRAEGQCRWTATRSAARVRRRLQPRTWAIESASGLGALLAQQLIAAGETCSATSAASTTSSSPSTSASSKPSWLRAPPSPTSTGSARWAPRSSWATPVTSPGSRPVATTPATTAAPLSPPPVDLLPTQARRGQEHQGGAASPRAPDRQGCLPTPRRRYPPLIHGGPGRADGTTRIQRDRPCTLEPALRRSHSRTRQRRYARHPRDASTRPRNPA
jgi:hypothetical protein